MNRFLTILFVCCISLTSYSQDAFDPQEIPKKALKIAKNIEKDGEFLSGAVGIAGIEPEQWRRYLELKKLCGDIELFQLTNHPSPAVRAYAFQGLMDNESLLLMAAIEKNQSDTAYIMHQSGCIASESPLIELIAMRTYNKYKHTDFLSEKDLELLEKIRSRMIERYKKGNK